MTSNGDGMVILLFYGAEFFAQAAFDADWTVGTYLLPEPRHLLQTRGADL